MENSRSFSPEETSVDMKEEFTPRDTSFESWYFDKLPLLFSRGLVSEIAIRLIFVVRRKKKRLWWHLLVIFKKQCEGLV